MPEEELETSFLFIFVLALFDLQVWDDILVQDFLELSLFIFLLSKVWYGDALSVFVNNEDQEYTKNAIQGEYHINEDSLIFTPFYPFWVIFVQFQRDRRVSHLDSSRG